MPHSRICERAGHLTRAVEHGDARRASARPRAAAAPGRIAVTPVRATPRPAGGSGSSRTTVTCPTRTPVTSAIEQPGPGSSPPMRRPCSRRLAGRAHTRGPYLRIRSPRGTRDARRVERQPPPARSRRRDLGRRSHPRHRAARARGADPRAARGAAARASWTPSRSPMTRCTSVHDPALVELPRERMGRLGGGRARRGPRAGPRGALPVPAPGSVRRAGSGRARRPRSRRGPGSSPTTR